MRLRSNSFTSKLRTNAAIENQLNNLTIDVSHFKKKIIPLSQENVQLKEKYHQFKFEIEDSLQQVIILFDQEDQFKAKVNNVHELCQLIKSIFQKTQQSLLQNQQQINDLLLQEQQLKNQMDQMELDHLHQFQQLQQQHATHLSQKELQCIQLREEYSELKEINQQKEEEIQTFQLRIDKILLQSKQESQLLIDELKYTIEQKCDEITQIKSQHSIDLSKQQFNLEKEKKFLKDELEQLQAKVEQKYKKLYLDHQQLIQSQIQSEQQIKTLKQQKESTDKQIQALNLKKQQITDELVENKKNRAKETKQIQDLLEQINALNMKYELEHKRNLKLQESNTLLEQESQNLHKNRNTEIIQLQQQIEILNSEILSQQQKEQKSKDEFISQLLIQKVKYENLLGNQIKVDNLTYTMYDASSQYDDPTFKQIVEDFELQLSQLHSQNNQLQNQLIAVTSELQKVNQTLTHQFEVQIREFKQKSKQLLNKQQQDFELQKQLILQEHQNRIQLLSNQMSYEIDKEKRTSKNLANTIDLMQNNLNEKDSLLDQFLEEIEKLKFQSTQAQIIHEQNMKEQQDLMKQFEQHSQDQYSQYIGHQKELQLKIDSLVNEKSQLNTQIKDLQQQLKVENLNVSQLKATLEKRVKENIFQQEMIGKLNDKIRQLIMDVENAKQTFNIFARQNTQTTRNLEFDYNIKRQIQVNSDSKLKKPTNRIKTSPERKLRSISNTKLSSVLKLNN